MKVKMNFVECETKKGLISMIIPMIIIMFLDIAYNIVDSIWVGNLLGKTYYAALTNATPIILLLIALSLGSTNGIAISISQAIGLKNKEKLEKIISTSFLLNLTFSIIIVGFLEVFLKQILKLINVPVQTYAISYKYLVIYILGYIPMFLYLYFTAVLRSFGNLKFQVIPMVISIVLNIILDPLFIKIMGFKGVALATVISEIISLLIILIYILRKKAFSLNVKKFSIKISSDIVKNVIPLIVQQGLPAISTIFLTGFISNFGIIPLDAYGIIICIEKLLLYPAMALNMVLTVIIGQCFGANRLDRIKDYIRLAIKYGVITLLIVDSLIIIFSKQLSDIFIRGDKISQIVMIYFIIVGIGYILNYITNCCLGFFNGIGQPIKGMLIMIFYYLIIRIP
ncbi:MAG: MATE family efflux transporter, partial [Sarcina sp.]